MKRMARILGITVIAAVVVFALVSCFDLYTDDEPSLIINLAGNSRALTGFNGAVDSKDIEFSVKLTNTENGTVKYAVINSAKTQASAKVEAGNWDILAEAFVFGYPYATGEVESFLIERGQNSVSISMGRLANAVALSVPNGSRRTFNNVHNVPRDPFEITVYNFTDDATKTITAELSTDGGFSLDTYTMSISQDGNDSFYINFDTNTADTYNSILTVKADGSEIASIDLALTVTPLPSYSVTFVLNGGTVLPSPQTVDYLGTATKPATNPIPPASGAGSYRFRGWYTDNGAFTQEFNFDTPITNNITLYADWGYRVGDTGPGGGIIAYRETNASGFYVYVLERTAYYLEAAPNDLPYNGAKTLVWAPVGSPANNNVEEAKNEGIGWGRYNTQQILEVCNTPATEAPAAYACWAYTGGGLSDWFLPSRHEGRTIYEAGITGDLLTSTQSHQYDAFMETNGMILLKYQDIRLTRPVRAF